MASLGAMWVLVLVLVGEAIPSEGSDATLLPLCDALQMGQNPSLRWFVCDPSGVVNPRTLEAVGCTTERVVQVPCVVIDGVECIGDRNFTKSHTCRYTNGFRWRTALALSVFLGVLGVDRFYLGYPVIGLLKLFTGGFFLIGAVVDVLLITLQILGPADGSDYVLPPWGPHLAPFRKNEETALV